MIRVDTDTPVAVHASPKRSHTTCCQVDPQTLSLGVLPVIPVKICNILLNIALNARQLLVLIFLAEDPFGNPAINRHEHRLIVLIPQLVHHDQDLSELWQDVEVVSVDQVGIY